MAQARPRGASIPARRHQLDDSDEFSKPTFFSLGATLHKLLTGRPPFLGSTAIETLDLVRTNEPAPPGTLVPGLPRDLTVKVREDQGFAAANLVAICDLEAPTVGGVPAAGNVS